MVLEKIGLPAKPSMRGSNWVVDASHCQGCSSQFTFINRKHHCRRCGGLFCGSCTQQRMILRGQGDSPVRICEPCKKLEEAARFELRHGHKNRSSRGGSKLTAKNEDEVLNQILGTDIQPSSFSRSETSSSSVLSDFEKGTSNASSSNFNEETATSVETQNSSTEDIGSHSPEELLQMSLEEKKKYRVLKGEGKPEEALRAFKRGKELERQSKSLELALKKNSRKALASNSLADKTSEESERSIAKSKLSSHIPREEKKDLASELRELGWSDADLQDADKKPVNMSLEGELSTLLREVHKKSGTGKGTESIDKTQVIALKKKALAFKREGKLAEAKEELKKAKVLEKQLEEQEFLAEAEDSDDELSSLIRSMGDDKQDDISLLSGQDASFGFSHLVGVSDDLGLDGNFDVTEEDMEDPDIAAALESLGWTENSEHPEVPSAQSAPVERKQLLDEILALKKEAVRQKRSGNVQEAMALLRKAKLLEMDAESLQPQGNVMETKTTIEKVLTSQTAGSSPLWKVDDEIGGTSIYVEPKLQTKSKLMIQRELLSLKKRALVLRREGRVEEAEEELRKGKVLESQLEEMESGTRARPTKVSGSSKISDAVHKQPGIAEVVGLGEEDDEADVSEHDLQDPTMLKMLESLGWKDEDSEIVSARDSNLLDSHSKADTLQSTTGIVSVAPKRSKADIQRELLGLKRKALTLRRQGEIKEAEEMLSNAKLLEAQMEEIEVPKKELLPNLDTNTQEAPIAIYSFGETQPTIPSSKSSVVPPHHDMPDPAPLSSLDSFRHLAEPVDSVDKPRIPSEHVADQSKPRFGTPSVAVRSKAEIQRELLGLKRKALTLRRQGEAEEAEEVLKMAKVLEEQIEEMTAPKKEVLLDAPKDTEPGVGLFMSKEKPGYSTAAEEVTKGTLELLLDSKDVDPALVTGSRWNNNTIAMPPISASISTPKISHSIGNTAPLLELDLPNISDEVEQAGSFPQSDQSANLMDLLSGDYWQSSPTPVEKMDSSTKISSSDYLYAHSGISKSPNKVIGSKDESLSENRTKFVGRVEKEPVPETNLTPLLDSQNNPTGLRHQILAGKKKALALKREGKIAEAREELRQAKLLERSLQEGNPQTDAVSTDAVVITSNDTSPLQEERKPTQQAPNQLKSRDRFKLQQESLAHKRQALKLRREGRMAEAEAEFELAKALETQLEESSGNESSSKRNSEAEGTDDLGVEDLLDPQLLSALKAIGIQDAVPQAPNRLESTKPNVTKSDTSSQEKSELEERIKAEKVKAVNLKRAGKQAEALDALRHAKMYERKLNTLA